ncbi:hypothetical protein BT69DRAFT_1295239 [Atractiella rhizophila]|nr:hypothetical protein BT69DRAFT_1295239 [Atractiella rhizophila]
MSAFSSNIFDPPVVKALCKQVLETHTRQKAGNKKGNWLVDWETMWTSQSVNDTVEKWKKNKNIMGEEGQLFFAAQVLEYRKIVNRVLDREMEYLTSGSHQLSLESCSTLLQNYGQRLMLANWEKRFSSYIRSMSSRLNEFGNSTLLKNRFVTNGLPAHSSQS